MLMAAASLLVFVGIPSTAAEVVQVVTGLDMPFLLVLADITTAFLGLSGCDFAEFGSLRLGSSKFGKEENVGGKDEKLGSGGAFDMESYAWRVGLLFYMVSRRERLKGISGRETDVDFWMVGYCGEHVRTLTRSLGRY